MSYINVGARINGVRVKTKKALREALRDAPNTVEFDSTSPMGPQFNGRADTMPGGGVTLTVVGPDPYTKRTWFASVKRDGSGFKVA